MLYPFDLKPDKKYLSSSLFRKNPKPVTNHCQDGGEIGQTEQDPEPHQRFVPAVAALNARIP